jgi:hypothetical protein
VVGGAVGFTVLGCGDGGVVGVAVGVRVGGVDGAAVGDTVTSNVMVMLPSPAFTDEAALVDASNVTPAAT